MTRATLEHAFGAEALDELFERTARHQYTQNLTFSTVVALLEAVVFRRHPSVHSAYLHSPVPVPVSLSSLDDKLNHTEPGIVEALVRHTASRLDAVLGNLSARSDPVPGLRMKILDGNHLAGTDHRIKELRGHGAAALPGLTLVVRDERTGLLTDIVAGLDAHAQERSLVGCVLELIRGGELWVADRNFAIDALFDRVASEGSYYVVRYHANTPLHELTPLTAAGTAETGEVFEQQVRVGKTRCRSVLLRLTEPTADGEREIRVLTNLPAEKADAARVAEVYRRRWRIEHSFLELTTSLRCEVSTLGYPQAALLGFSLAVCACNVLCVVTAALEQAETQTRQELEPKTDSQEDEWEASCYAVAVELRVAYDGLVMSVGSDVWDTFARWRPDRLAKWLLRVARDADRARYRKSKRGPKKPVERVKAGRKAPHRSTFRLLAQRAKPPKPIARP
jgi:IS4 transposase